MSTTTMTDEVTEVTPAIEVPNLAELAEERHVNRFAEQAENQIVNPIVLAELIGVRPQMVYNYIRKGKIATTPRLNSTQKITIPLEEAQAFAQAYLLKKGLKALKVQQELEAHANGDSTNVTTQDA